MKEPFDEPTIPGPQARYYEGRAMFGGRFLLARQLGRGGMGEVWRATDRELGEDVALKFAPPEVVGDERCVGELRREALAGRALSHPSIVRVYDFHAGEGEAAVSMEYVAGKTLNGLLAEEECGFFEVEAIRGWVEDVVEALRYAHGREKRIHRDLKPANIIVERSSGAAKLLDFGISRKMADTYTRTTGKDTSGSLAYMGPQQLRGERTLPEDDHYSLGATVYELLTGAPPFFQGDLRTQIEGVVPPSMARRRKELAEDGAIAGTGAAIPEEWEEAVRRCLAKEREGRVWSLEAPVRKRKKTVEKEAQPEEREVARPPAQVARPPEIPAAAVASQAVQAPAPAPASRAMRLPLQYRKGFLWFYFLLWMAWTGAGVTDYVMEMSRQSLPDVPTADANVPVGRHALLLTRAVPHVLADMMIPTELPDGLPPYDELQGLGTSGGKGWWENSSMHQSEKEDVAELVFGGGFLGMFLALGVGGVALFVILMVGIWSRHFLRGRCPITVWVLTWGYVGVSVLVYTGAFS